MGVKCGSIRSTEISFFLADLGFVSGWADWLVVNILKSTGCDSHRSIDRPIQRPVWGVQMYTLQVFVHMQTNGSISSRARNLDP